MKKIFLTASLVLTILFATFISVTKVSAFQTADPCMGDVQEPYEAEHQMTQDNAIDCTSGGGGGGGGGGSAQPNGPAPTNDTGTGKRYYSSLGSTSVSTRFNADGNGLQGQVRGYIELPNTTAQIERLSGFSPINPVNIEFGGSPSSIWTVPETGRYSINFSSTGAVRVQVEHRGNFNFGVDFYIEINGQKTALAGPKAGYNCDPGVAQFGNVQYSIIGSCTDNRGPYYDSSTGYSVGYNNTVQLNAGDVVRTYADVRGYAKYDSALDGGSGPQGAYITLYHGQTILDVNKIETNVPPTASISARRMSIMSGESTTLDWSSTNATACTATDGWSGSKASAGYESTGALTSTTTYVITCSGPGGNSSPATVTVTVVQPPTTPTGFTATTSNACANNWLNLSWNAVSGASSYIVKEGSTTIYSGSATSFSHTGLAPSSSHTYTIVATNAAGTSSTATATGTVVVECSNPPTTPTGFTATASNACANNWLNLSWNAVSGATSYTVKEGSRVVYTGSATAISDPGLVSGSSHTYTVVATNASGTSATASATGTVIAACEIPGPTTPTGFTATASNACANNWLNIAWNPVSGATYYTVTEGARIVYSGSSTAISDTGLVPGSTHTYTLTASNANGTSAAAYATGTVYAACAGGPSATLISEAGNSVPYNSYFVLNWSTANVTDCNANNVDVSWVGNKATAGGRQNVYASATKTYVIDCTGPSGPASASVTVAVTGAPVSTPTVSISANPTSVTSGSSSQLSWSSTNADSCTASNGWSGTKAISGSVLTGAMYSSTTYSLTCTGSGGSAVSGATVTVTAAPEYDVCNNIAGTQTSAPSGMYEGGDGNCYEPTDYCNNIDGVQNGYPFGMKSDGAGGCISSASKKPIFIEF